MKMNLHIERNLYMNGNSLCVVSVRKQTREILYITTNSVHLTVFCCVTEYNRMTESLLDMEKTDYSHTPCKLFSHTEMKIKGESKE